MKSNRKFDIPGGFDRFLSRKTNEKDELVHEDGWDDNDRNTIHVNPT